MALKDTFFISHGSPTLSIDESIEARKFLQSWKKDVFEERPKSILVISAHWETTVPTVNVIQTTNDTIYDFYNFPKPMYQVSFFLSLFFFLFYWMIADSQYIDIFKIVFSFLIRDNSVWLIN